MSSEYSGLKCVSRKCQDEVRCRLGTGNLWTGLSAVQARETAVVSYSNLEMVYLSPFIFLLKPQTPTSVPIG
jgi:hypothetical protein